MARAREAWEDYPSEDTLVRAQDLEFFDSSIDDLQTLFANTQALTSTTYGEAASFGNVAGSFTFSGTGSPTDIYAPLVIYQRYGFDTPNSNVLKTTQAWFSAAVYYGPTTDDSMECGSCFVAAKDTGTGYTQALSMTAFEGHVQVEGSNHATGTVIGVGARVSATAAGSTIDDASAFYAGAVNSTGTITNYVAFEQGNTSPGDNNWGVKVYDKIQTQTQFVLERSGDAGSFSANWAGSGGGTPAFIYAQNPDGTNFATMRLQAITGQVHPILTIHDTAGAQQLSISRLGTLIGRAGISAQNSGGTDFAGLNTDGVWTKKNAAPVDGNISAGQLFFWMDSTDGAAKLKLKGKSADGTVVTGEVALA